MALRVVGSGLGRTGTMSLKAALERLLGGRCYHMLECIDSHIHQWRAAIEGESVNWESLLGDFVATVDWPAAACWKGLARTYPEALILHSERAVEEWFRSADRTIFEMFKRPREDWSARTGEDWTAMAVAMLEQFTPDFLDPDAAMAAAEAWNADVRASADPDRLLIWSPGDGWEPICAALDVPVPDEPFPHSNSTEEFRDRAGLDPV